MLEAYWMMFTLIVNLSNVTTLVATLPAPVRSSILANDHVNSGSLSEAIQRRPRRRLGGRSGICIVSPGLLEGQNIIWSDRPLFLWQADPETTMKQLVLTDQEGKILWQKSLMPTDQWVIYDGSPLQPGQFYTWRLEWSVQDTPNSTDYTFQVMPSDQRQPITIGLQTLTQRLQTTGASADAIANQQADYFLNQTEELWSDALNMLYAIQTPSLETRQRRQDWVNSVCGEGGQ